MPTKRSAALITFLKTIGMQRRVAILVVGSMHESQLLNIIYIERNSMLTKNQESKSSWV